MDFTCRIRECSGEAKIDGMCVKHALESAKKGEVRVMEEPPKKRGRPPKVEAPVTTEKRKYTRKERPVEARTEVKQDNTIQTLVDKLSKSLAEARGCYNALLIIKDLTGSKIDLPDVKL